MNPTGGVRAAMLLAALHLGASLAGCSTGDEVVEADVCAMDELEVVDAGEDGAGGHKVALFGVSTRAGPCELTEPSSAIVIGGDEAVPRGTFFPMRPFGPILEAGEQAVIAVETTSCDVDSGPHGRGVEILFDNGHTITLPLRSDGCNLRWDGFMIWE